MMPIISLTLTELEADTAMVKQRQDECGLNAAEANSEAASAAEHEATEAMITTVPTTGWWETESFPTIIGDGIVTLGAVITSGIKSNSKQGFTVQPLGQVDIKPHKWWQFWK
jgi:hypothetical protein